MRSIQMLKRLLGHLDSQDESKTLCLKILAEMTGIECSVLKQELDLPPDFKDDDKISLQDLRRFVMNYLNVIFLREDVELLSTTSKISAQNTAELLSKSELE